MRRLARSPEDAIDTTHKEQQEEHGEGGDSATELIHTSIVHRKRKRVPLAKRPPLGGLLSYFPIIALVLGPV
jgi:hypothetical protein